METMFFNIYVCKTKSLPVLPFRAAYIVQTGETHQVYPVFHSERSIMFAILDCKVTNK